MNQFSFRSWLTEYGDLFWEGLRDISALPMDKINLVSIDKDNDGDSDFEEEEFDRDSAWDSCSDAGDYIDVSDYSDEPIYDDPDEDEDFDAQSADAWAEENPEPERENFKTDEEYSAAVEKWQEEYDQVDEEYDDAVKKWKQEMESRRESAEENAQSARDEAISDCVDERESEHNQEQEERRERHEEERRNNPHLDADNAGYTSHFTVGQDNFEVSMDREKIDYQRMELSGVFGVTFRGPAGYSLTNKNTGSEAMQKYNHLLASVAKMVQEEKNKGRIVNGFTFYPAEPAMGLMYQKFYTDYLKPAGYMRVKPDLYLRKDYIRELTAEMPDYQKKSAYSQITNTGREVRAGLEKVRAEKALMRTVKTTLPKLVGNLILFKKPYSYREEPIAGLVVKAGIESREPEATVVGHDGAALATHQVSFRNIFNIAPDPADPKGIAMKLFPLGMPTPDRIIPLLKAVSQAPHLLTSIDGVHFRKLLAQYGIQPQVAQQPQQPAEAEPDMSWLTNPQPQPV